MEYKKISQMKFSNKFEGDYKWYLEVSDRFNFDGSDQYCNKKGQPILVEDPHGVTAKEAFYFYDSQGVIKPTREPEGLHRLLKTKGSVNLHIKMYAEDRAKGYLPRRIFEEMCKEFNAPEWFIVAVEQQKNKYYD